MTCVILKNGFAIEGEVQTKKQVNLSLFAF